MIGAGYRSAVTQAVLGPYRSQVIPTTLHIGWLDATGELIGMAGVSVQHTAFGPLGDGVVNVAAIDAGVAGTGWAIAAVGLFDGDGNLVISADLPAPYSPDSDEPLSFAPGGLVFEAA